MFNQMRYLLCLMLLIFTVSNATTAPVIFTDPAQPIIVHSSSPIVVIRVASNPTTGYSWFLKKYDHKYLQPVSHKFYPPKKMLIGAGGYQEWIFTATPKAFSKQATAKIRLVYTRPWEKTYAKDLTFIVKTE